MKLDKIDHIAIQVNNIEESISWYESKFNCKRLYADESWGLIQFGNIKLALVINSQHPNHFAVIDDLIYLDSESEKHRDGSVSKYITDKDNNIIELLSYQDES
tara:strand:- start:3 stop:311 length:309 start_codon:yes stop_codon:yes gene_type:complete